MCGVLVSWSEKWWKGSPHIWICHLPRSVVAPSFCVTYWFTPSSDAWFQSLLFIHQHMPSSSCLLLLTMFDSGPIFDYYERVTSAENPEAFLTRVSRLFREHAPPRSCSTFGYNWVAPGLANNMHPHNTPPLTHIQPHTLNHTQSHTHSPHTLTHTQSHRQPTYTFTNPHPPTHT